MWQLGTLLVVMGQGQSWFVEHGFSFQRSAICFLLWGDEG